MSTRISTRNRDKVVQLGAVGGGEAWLNLASAVQSEGTWKEKRNTIKC